jgi:hypothetical protein
MEIFDDWFHDEFNKYNVEPDLYYVENPGGVYRSNGDLFHFFGIIDDKTFQMYTKHYHPQQWDDVISNLYYNRVLARDLDGECFVRKDKVWSEDVFWVSSLPIVHCLKKDGSSFFIAKKDLKKI